MKIKPCQNENCIMYHPDYKCSWAAREDMCELYTDKKPETAWEMFRRLGQDYSAGFLLAVHKKYKTSCATQAIMRWFLYKPEPEAIRIMTEIEKELKDE